MISKSEIVNHVISCLKDKENTLDENVRSIKDSQSDDTKSSAGDKFETGREMMQAELDKNENQLSKTKLLIRELEKIDTTRKLTKAEFGSLVQTSSGIYFISIGLGRMPIGKEVFFAISLNSPIGKVLEGKKPGDSFLFHGKKELVLEVN